MRLIFAASFLIIFFLFEAVLFYPPFIYIFAALTGVFFVFGFLKIKKKFGFDRRIFIWLAAGFLYLLTSSFFLMFMNEARLRHVLILLSAFLIAFWAKRFRLYLYNAIGFSKIDFSLFRIISLATFYFGVAGIYGAAVFLNVHSLALFGLFLLLAFVCTMLFWESAVFAKTETATGAVDTLSVPKTALSAVEILEKSVMAEQSSVGKFIWLFVSILCSEMAVAVYFLPLPIFSLAAIVFLFWGFLVWIFYDFYFKAFNFKKYRVKLIASLVFVGLILLLSAW